MVGTESSGEADILLQSESREVGRSPVREHRWAGDKRYASCGVVVDALYLLTKEAAVTKDLLPSAGSVLGAWGGAGETDGGFAFEDDGG